jgi:hypothetical protein
VGAALVLWLLRRRDPRGAALLAAGLALPVAAGYGAIAAAAGEPFASVRELGASTLKGMPNFRDPERAAARLHRWTIGYPVAVLSPASGQFSTVGTLLWAFVAGALLLQTLGEPGAWRFLAGLALGVWAMLIWWPMSLDPPVPAFIPAGRYLSVVLVPIAAVAAAGLARLIRAHRTAGLGALALLVGCFLATDVVGAEFRRAYRAMSADLVARAEASAAGPVYADAHVVMRARAMGRPPGRWREEMTLEPQAPPAGAVLLADERAYRLWRPELGDRWEIVWTADVEQPRSGRQMLARLRRGPEAQERVTWRLLRPRGP